MVYDYYPGCTLKSKAKSLDISARRSAAALGIELKELDEWQCCGGVYNSCSDEVANKLSAVRALSDAEKNTGTLVSVCSACHHVLKSVNEIMKAPSAVQDRANAYLALDEPYRGQTNVVHYLELLRDAVGFSTLSEKIKKPLAGRKIAAYYGCLMLRPSRVMRFDDPEKPRIMEDFIASLGAEPVIYPMRNECCGGYVRAVDADVCLRRCGKIIESALEHSAEKIITACPLCMYNLKKRGGIEVEYFTAPLCEALGIGENDGE